MNIYISGSVAYDRIMNFPGRFSDSILPHKIEHLNVSFCVTSLIEQFGGNAGNTAYSLNLLQESPIVISAVGKDFYSYEQHFINQNLSLEAITYVNEERTACAYINTDLDNNQITAFHPAAMLTPSSYNFPKLSPATDLAIICPTNVADMQNHPKKYKQNKVRYIYDPSQQLPLLSSDDLLEGILDSYILIGNAYEIELISNKTGKSKKELLDMTELGIITTLSEHGSLITHKDGSETSIKAIPLDNIVDPTGAGDAYRAGLLKGLFHNWDIVESAKLGSTCAAFCLEAQGPQGQKYTFESCMNRYKNFYGSN